MPVGELGQSWLRPQGGHPGRRSGVRMGEGLPRRPGYGAALGVGWGWAEANSPLAHRAGRLSPAGATAGEAVLAACQRSMMGGSHMRGRGR